MKLTARAVLLSLGVLASCAHEPIPHPGASNRAIPPGKERLAAVMWPVAKAIIYCTRRLDDYARPIGVAGPCWRLEAGDTEATKTLSWSTLGRFETSPPDTTPASYGGRCHLEIEQGQRTPELKPARLIWVTPTGRKVLDDWMPTDDPDAIEADGYTTEATFAPEGEWMAILHVAVGLGDGERVVSVPHAKMVRVPACE